MVMHPYIAKHLVESRVEDLRRAAGGASPQRPADDAAARRPDARAVPFALRPFARAKRALAEASEPCT
jgi:hypothetical protein